MIKILVTGSNGQLGKEFRRLSDEFPQYHFIHTDVEELDITDKDAVGMFFEVQKPSVVINCAAYTAVDLAEQEIDRAFEINGTAAGGLAMNASSSDALLIHISTDYVYSGNNNTPYVEENITDPQSVYGKSKLQGELEVQAYSTRGIIIRTSWLYSEFNANFVKTILSRGQERGQLNVVYDQTGTPTYAGDLAKAILGMIPVLEDHSGVEVFHYANEGLTSWYDFAKSIVEISGIQCDIWPVLTEDYPLPAKRPVYSVLNKAKIKRRFGLEIPYWRDSLKECLKRITNYGLRKANSE